MPIIADAVVVRVEEGTHQHETPPPINPNYVDSKKQAKTQINTCTTMVKAGNFSPTSTAIVPAGNVSSPTSTSIVPAGNFAPINPRKPAHLTVPTNNLYQLGRGAAGLTCPHCKRQTITVVQDFIGVGTVVAIVILAIFFWPLCWLPLCIPSCKRTHHFCGHNTCGRKVGETSVCD